MNVNPVHVRLSLAAVGLTLAALVSACEPESADFVAGSVPELVIRATDNDYPETAETAAGLTEITIDNQGTELHQVALLQLTDGKSFDDFTAYAATAKETDPLPNWAVPAGGPAVAAPGQKASTFVPLESGTYAMVCNIPDAKGVPHVQKGMIKPLTVTDSEASSTDAPAADVEIKQLDFAFQVPAKVSAGEHVIAVSNAGKQPHEAVLVKLDEGATAADVAAAFAPGASGPPPALPLGGVVAIPAGASQSFPADLTAGRYGLLCFLGDPASAQPHVALGMMAEFDVE